MAFPNIFEGIGATASTRASSAGKRAATESGFRPDIEGLRAVAVVSVLLYHLEVKWAPGGFVGVDIFFVISGFLMAKIIAGEIGNGRFFNVWRFYERRIFRIWPAMFVVILATLVVGAVTLVPDDLADLAKSALTSLVAANNFLFWEQSGYFSSDAQRNTLLHLWSLAVEQQFYVTMPWLMLLAFWRAPRARIWPVLLLAGASLLFCIYATPRARSASFFMLPMRYWEFLLGTAVALGASKFRVTPFVRECLAVLGLVIIAGTVAGLNRQAQFPGYWALLPCVGTALVIFAGADVLTTSSRFLSAAPLEITGRLSYSLYLWHWPIITYCRLWGFSIDTLSVQLSILASTFVLSYLSWRYIEVPFRGPNIFSTGKRAVAVAGTAVLVAAVSVIFVTTGGLPSRLDPNQRMLLAYERYPAKKALYREGTCFLTLEQSATDYRTEDCAQTNPNRTDVLLWGDSHAAHYAPGMREVAEKFGINVVQATYSGCAPVPSRKSNSETCADFGKKIWKLISSGKFDRIIISANWAGYPGILPELSGEVRELSMSGTDVAVIGPSLEFRRNLPTLLASRSASLFSREDGPAAWLAEYAVVANGQMRDMFANIPHVSYVAPISEVCRDGSCPVLMGDGVPLAWDASHLTADGSVFMANVILGKLAQIKSPAASSGTQTLIAR